MSTTHFLFTLAAIFGFCWIIADIEAIVLVFFKKRLQARLCNDKKTGRPFILVFLPVKFFGKVLNITITKRRPAAK
jgi:hypothetical protein